MEKVCDTCGVPKPLTNFALRAKKNHTSNPLANRVKTCRKCLRLRKNQKGLCQCGRKLATGTRCDTCRAGHQRNGADRRLRYKRAALAHYGKSCVYCDEDREIFLTIDHINNDGAEHRREIGRSGNLIHQWLRKADYPPGFQTACFNCNCAKAVAGEAELCRVLGINRPRPACHSIVSPPPNPGDTDAGRDHQRMAGHQRQRDVPNLPEGG